MNQVWIHVQHLSGLDSGQISRGHKLVGQLQQSRAEAVPPDRVVGRDARLLYRSPALTILQPLPVGDESLPRGAVDLAATMKSVCHHRGADVSIHRITAQCRSESCDAASTWRIDLLQVVGRQQVPRSDIVAELFNSARRRKAAAHAGLAQPQVRQFVQESKCPGSTVIVGVEHHEWSNGVRERNSSEDIGPDACVMTSEIALQQHEHSGALGLATQEPESLLRSRGVAELSKRQVKGCLNRGKDSLDAVVHRSRADERDRLHIVLDEHGRLKDALSGSNLTDQRIQPGLVSRRTLGRVGPIVFTSVRSFWRSVQIEDDKRATIHASHLGQHGSCGSLTTGLQCLKSINGIDSPGTLQLQLAHSLGETESCSLASPPQDLRVDVDPLHPPVSALNRSLNAPWVWARCWVRKPIITMTPSPCSTDTMAAFSAIASSPSSQPLCKMSRSG